MRWYGALIPVAHTRPHNPLPTTPLIPSHCDLFAPMLMNGNPPLHWLAGIYNPPPPPKKRSRLPHLAGHGQVGKGAEAQQPGLLAAQRQDLFQEGGGVTFMTS